MPKIKISHVVSFSSEDPVHCANNLLSGDTSKKWKCLNPGEKSASVVLQLEKACIISNIDIGNEHSAYVEVLASRSSSNDDYKILLVMSTFMSPLESKQSTNINKVRMFTKDQLQDPECNEKWDRIKIVCTQPFNRHVQYGLSFVTLHTPEEINGSSLGVTTIGKFLMRPDSPDTIGAGSLFAKRKELSQEPLTGAAAIRQSSSLALNGSPITKKCKDPPVTPKHKTNSDLPEPEIGKKERNRDEILYSKDDTEPNGKIDRLVENKKKEAEQKKQQEDELVKKKQDKKTKTVTNVASSSHVDSPPSSSRRLEESKRKAVGFGDDKLYKRIKTDVKRKPFSKLFEDVVLVISGIQHPERGDIRSKAMEMGSKYKPDWDIHSTHLVCAFPNTPKFNQVKGKGKIVTKNWIYDCYRERKRFPWRRYALDKSDFNKEESEDEIWEQKELGSIRKKNESSGEISANSGSDTEDEIERIQTKQIKVEEKEDEKIETEIDPFAADTEEEEIILKQNDENLIDPSLPNFFEHHVLYIDKKLPVDDIKKLEKYIHAYNGVLIEELGDIIDIILTSKEKLNGSLREWCPDAKVVDFKWIWECHNCQKLVCLDNYLL